MPLMILFLTFWQQASHRHSASQCSSESLWIFDAHCHGSTHLDVVVLVLLQQHGLQSLHQGAKFGLVVLDVNPPSWGSDLFWREAAHRDVCNSDVGVVASAYSDKIRTVI